MTSGPGVTVGPPRCLAPAVTRPIPVKPVSVEPIASLRKTPGSAAAKASLTGAENNAPLEEMDSIDEAS